MQIFCIAFRYLFMMRRSGEEIEDVKKHFQERP